jgi:hypothetical protein
MIMKDLLEQCVKEAVTLWHHIALEAESPNCATMLYKKYAIRKYNLKLETVSESSANCPYCFYDDTVGNNVSSCANCPGVLLDGTGFPNSLPNATPCFADGSPYRDFELHCELSVRTEGAKQMYELTKRVAEFYNVQVEV